MKIKPTNAFNSIQAEFLFDYAYSERFDFKALKTYDSYNNYLLAQLCMLVYSEQDEIEAQIKNWQNHDPGIDFEIIQQTNSDGSFRCLLVSSDDYLILSFRGTPCGKDQIIECLLTWIGTNLKYKLIPFTEGEGKVHEGFHRSIQAMSDNLVKAINKHTPNEKKIYLTGHSLGSAQALLAAFMLPELENFVSITTFAQPKVGDKNFAEYLATQLNTSDWAADSKYFRILNELDIVVHFPGIGYNHTGAFNISSPHPDKPYELRETRNLTEIEAPRYEKNSEKRIKDLIEYHLMEYYLKNAEINKDNPVFK